MQFILDKQIGKTVSIIAIRVQELLMISSVLVSVYSMPIDDLSSDDNQQKIERIRDESNVLHIWWFAKPPDEISNFEPPVTHATRWNIKV
ncbi:hypothetical protein AVEN_272375-1 [Araneus ventricosus]|uniref:Uncharacterized protein n=1 Tax=Araneus ventricosus TaxID=182803 RepID=A0A4Y2I1J3_ARAVE|nr:hypothetical protein AVEN_272375-1 [Araneus ventricosus]